jgi:hypothetical protein
MSLASTESLESNALAEKEMISRFTTSILAPRSRTRSGHGRRSGAKPSSPSASSSAAPATSAGTTRSR